MTAHVIRNGPISGFGADSDHLSSRLAHSRYQTGGAERVGGGTPDMLFLDKKNRCDFNVMGPSQKTCLG